jgi:hypothetical protein
MDFDWSEFLWFRRFLTPIAIQGIFWLGLVIVVLSGLGMLFHSFFLGLVYLIVGPVLVRINCELVILLFRIYEELVAIRTGTPPGGMGFPVMPVTPVEPSSPQPPPTI